MGVKTGNNKIFPHFEFIDLNKNKTFHGYNNYNLKICGTLTEQMMLYQMTPRSLQSDISFKVKCERPWVDLE